jgi:hypothetical protein
MDESQGLLAACCEAVYLLARFHPPALRGVSGGRSWERWASQTLKVAGAWIRQGPGHLTLFGEGAASGLRHELDGCGACGSATVLVEAKAYGNHGPSKEDLMFLDRKTFDLYVARRRAGEAGPHYRVIASTHAIDRSLRKYCCLYSIVAVDPILIPLPVLVRMAIRPAAGQFFQKTMLAEFVRLGRWACGPLESRYVPDGPHHLRFDINVLPEEELEDLLWLQEEITADLLELVDVEKPGYFEEQADLLLQQLGIRLSASAL